MKRKLFSLLALLMVAVSGAWAQTTHVVTQATVDEVFNGDGYTLGTSVSAGDVLDFQGTIDIEHSLVINKAVTVKSTTKDAVVKLNTDAGNPTYQEDPGKAFVINKAGAGAQVEGIRFENTRIWIYNTSNVTLKSVTQHVEDKSIGTVTGHLCIRWSDHVTLDGCTVYTKNNGTASACMLTGCNNCTIKDTSFEGEGNVANPLYLGNIYNTGDKPGDFGDNEQSTDCTVTGCTFTKSGSSSPMCIIAIGGLRHLIEGCTVENMSVSSAYGAATPASAADGHIYRNNTFKTGFSVIQYSTAENNMVTVSFSVGTGVTATGNSVKCNVTLSANATFTNNNVQGKVTASNKNTTITGNTITSTEEYAVQLNATAADANNIVTGNVLKAKEKTGDEAVNSKSTSNTVSNNVAPDYAFTVGTSEHGKIAFFIDGKEAIVASKADEGKTVTMTVSPDKGWVIGTVSATTYTTWAGARRKAPTSIPVLGDVTLTAVEGAANTWTFTMPAASVEASATYIPVAAFTAAPAAVEGIIAGEDKAIVTAGETEQGTVKYFVTTDGTMTAQQAKAADGWLSTLPTAAAYTSEYAEDFKVYVWYYIQAADGYADSEPQCIEVTLLKNIFDLTLSPAPVKNMTVTVAGQAKTPTDEGKVEAVKMQSEVKLKAATGYKFRKVEVKKKEAGTTQQEI